MPVPDANSGTSLQSPDRLTVHQMSADSTDCNDISSPRDKGHGHKQPLRFRILNNDISSHKSSNSSFDITPSRGLDHIDHQSRSLLKYFSEKVAPAMGPFNTVFNGYRDLILPLSEQDQTVKSAVLAAAASHISLKHCEWKPLASKYRMAAIRGLNQRSTAEYPNKSIDYSSLSTMVLLLVEQMIIVGTDFHILLRMMKSFIESQQCSDLAETEPLGTFLMQQIRKMSLYAGPLVMGLSAAKSLENMSNKDLDFLFSCLKIHPEYSSFIFKLANLIRTAAQIYLSRATNMPNQVIKELVQQFLADTASYNATSPGGHILIWPFFIVGAECSSEQDREFVTMQLQNLWDCTGFGSPLYAIKLLGDIWQEPPGTNWTQTLVDKVEGFIM
ncbi:hypothetical protein F9C07_2129924 [Aspergillus flavus]|uniref:Fungal-specific transcription factor domain-containing protein n=5 Tax=Aspergillus subgen. Circumdati TaxID=2720871 RepID=A0A7U2MEU3_ASPFN|nr:hypothetical protein F9C07_2129924 [Aspergillus flavus]